MAPEASFYFDFNSPYAYLAAERVDDLVPHARWKPIAFPILLQRQGRLEEAMRRDRRPVVEEVSRRAAERGLPPFTHPEGWPNAIWSFAPLRAAVFAEETGALREFSRAAFRKVFVEGLSLAEPANVAAAARETGLDAARVEESIGRPDIKDRLKQNTDKAHDRGVTGIPTVLIGDEAFWGDDRLEEAAARLRTSGD